jgi:hypothetical protein
LKSVLCNRAQSTRARADYHPTLAQRVAAEAERLDEFDAPQREFARRLKEADATLDGSRESTSREQATFTP